MKYYKITTTKGTAKIDEDDFIKFSSNCDSGKFIKLKKAVINPSFVVMIAPINKEEALEGEYSGEVSGYMDESTRTFKVTSSKQIVERKLKDEFVKEVKRIK